MIEFKYVPGHNYQPAPGETFLLEGRPVVTKEQTGTHCDKCDMKREFCIGRVPPCSRFYRTDKKDVFYVYTV